MAATVHIDEQNGDISSPALTHDIAHTNMGSIDSPNLDPVANPLTAGGNSCEKWQLIHVTDMSTSTRISNLKVWRNGTMSAYALHFTNASSSDYAGAAGYSTPTTATSTIANKLMPTDAPSTANLGIGGNLNGALTQIGQSDFLVHQIQTTPEALAGNTTNMNYQYDEAA